MIQFFDKGKGRSTSSGNPKNLKSSILGQGPTSNLEYGFTLKTCIYQILFYPISHITQGKNDEALAHTNTVTHSVIGLIWQIYFPLRQGFTTKRRGSYKV